MSIDKTLVSIDFALMYIDKMLVSIDFALGTIGKTLMSIDFALMSIASAHPYCEHHVIPSGLSSWESLHLYSHVTRSGLRYLILSL